jgi:hypothetical protein
MYLSDQDDSNDGDTNDSDTTVDNKIEIVNWMLTRRTIGKIRSEISAGSWETLASAVARKQ